MIDPRLTDILAAAVMGWKVGPERFLTGDRRWIAKWRFQPVERTEDALKLLDASGSVSYSLGTDGASKFWARVQIGGMIAEARADSMPAAITLAIAKAVGVCGKATR